MKKYNLFVVFQDGKTGNFPIDARQNLQTKSITRILTNLNYLNWEIAYLHENSIITKCFYCGTGFQEHTKAEAERLRKEARKTVRKQLKAYIVPTLQDQIERGVKPRTEWVSHQKEAEQFLTPEVSRIIFYDPSNNDKKLGVLTINGFLPV